MFTPGNKAKARFGNLLKSMPGLFAQACWGFLTNKNG